MALSGFEYPYSVVDATACISNMTEAKSLCHVGNWLGGLQTSKPARCASRQVVRASGDDWYGPDRPKFLVSVAISGCRRSHLSLACLRLSWPEGSLL